MFIAFVIFIAGVFVAFFIELVLLTFIILDAMVFGVAIVICSIIAVIIAALGSFAVFFNGRSCYPSFSLLLILICNTYLRSFS